MLGTVASGLYKPAAGLNGVVGNNTRRKLDPEEFRGFVLPHDYAPFVF